MTEFDDETTVPDPHRSDSVGALISQVVVAASTLATVVLSLLVGHLERFRVGFYDETVYRLHASNLMKHHFYGYGPNSSAYRPPGYAFFQAGIRTLNDSQVSIRMAQAILAGATVWLAARIAKRLFGDVAGAVSAVALLAVGTIVVYSSFELSETVATVTLVGAIAAALRAADAKSVHWSAASGVLLAMSAYVRPQGLLFIGPMAVWIAFAIGPAQLRRRMMLGGAAFLALIATVLPWTVRNAYLVHTFVPIATYGGEAFFLANNDSADGKYHPTNYAAPVDYPRIMALPEGRQEREWYRLAFRFIRAHPKKALHNWINDGFLFVRLEDKLVAQNYLIRGRGRPPIFDDRLLWASAAIGIIFSTLRRGRVRALLPALMIFYFLTFFMVFLPLARFRHGVLPFLAIESGAAVAAIVGWISGRLRVRGDQTAGP